MRKLIEPKLMLKHYQDFNGEEFYKRGYNTLFVDLDNTLAPYYELNMDKDVFDFLSNLEKIGFNVFVVSNNNKERVETYLKGTNFKYIFYALKPFKKNYKNLIAKYHLDKNKIVAMGDQMLTDVIGANRMGLYSIYVNPIIDKDSITTKLSRRIERFLFRYVVNK